MGLRAGGHRMIAHLHGKGVGGVDYDLDMMGHKPRTQTVHAAKTANAYIKSGQDRRAGGPGERDGNRKTVSPLLKCCIKLAGLRRAAQNQNPHPIFPACCEATP
ncbi:hypothetical protein AA15237_1550 [Komagataeibacter xylinus NBRC 15237]|nr:hypothetical protein AA15237_1550 [Komagataeibacter xylinus NBRC 15237]